ncbi:MAG: hypothetical protein GTN76_03135 [Candidatus Aenigmarchaeota archaeon]|nr:hypothetical protein [bacterium]NIO19744.1 hypothetical protein [Candidatus Aenigmarchaeota archaeon]
MKLFNPLIRILIDDPARRRFQQEGKDITGFRGFLRVFPGHFHRLTLYNPLGLLAGVAFIASVFSPWWHASVGEGRYSIDAYAFILSHNLPPEGWKYIIETPVPVVVILLLALSGYLFLAFWGSTMAGNKGKLYTAGSGVLMLIYIAGFYGTLLFASHRIGQPVSGQFVIYRSMSKVIVHTYFLPSYYCAIGAGIFSLLSSLTHGWCGVRFYRRKKVEKGEGNGL